jgi:hypothetical protein
MIHDRSFIIRWLQELRDGWKMGAVPQIEHATNAEAAIQMLSAPSRVPAAGGAAVSSPVKFFEVRDRATFLPVMAVRLTAARTSQDEWLMQRAGFADWQVHPESDTPYVILWRLLGGDANYDPYEWGNRTMANAHAHIMAHWSDLNSGDVIDVQFLLGENPTPKQSERLTNG